MQQRHSPGSASAILLATAGSESVSCVLAGAVRPSSSLVVRLILSTGARGGDAARFSRAARDDIALSRRWNGHVLRPYIENPRHLLHDVICSALPCTSTVWVWRATRTWAEIARGTLSFVSNLTHASFGHTPPACAKTASRAAPNALTYVVTPCEATKTTCVAGSHAPAPAMTVARDDKVPGN
jgi:hypothetical protein